MIGVPTWDRMLELEPDLATIEARVADGQLNMTDIIVNRILPVLVGPLARHPRLRSHAAFRRVYRHLACIRRPVRTAVGPSQGGV